ncbi:MAG: HlyD family efflux transporter periplasmic adaptor subunit [Dehalococcoidia bacterium]|nr:HlyD family efflux transporter periplasmic adaptor subunit [Dehalococcoidia bacterium]
MAALAGGAASRSDERPPMSEVDIDLLIRGRSSRRRWLLLGASAVLVAVAVATWFLLRPVETDVVAEPQRSEAVMGQLSTTVDLSGSAEAERSTTISFGVAGTVATVEVESGDAVQTGDVLATLDNADAQRRVATAETQLRLAELRLDALLADPAAAEIASARQSIESAETQVLNAEQALKRLTEPPTASELASAEQAVASALGQLSSAEEALVRLSEPPSVSELASAEQAVANALGQLSSAEEALARLSEPPSVSELASAEQAVANALGQLSSAEEALAALITGPGETEIAAARTDVTQARAQLSGAIDRADDSWHALEDAFDEFCEQYDHLNDVAEGPCTAPLALSDAQVRELRDLAEDRSSNFQRYASAVINANVAFVADDATRQSAVTALSSAEQRLADLLAPASEEDRYQAEQSVEAARANHASAVARLEELQAEPSAEDVRQAELAVEAARASHTAAVARLEELQAEPSAEDVRQAELAVEAARANHAAAAARFEDLRAPADEGEFDQARASLESARASLASAQARYDELNAGPTANAIAQQEENVRLSEISLEEARAALSDFTVTAPFHGIVQAVNVQPGDRVAASLAAFTLSTSDRILIALTVTEADLLSLEVGQAGIATFDAIENVEYPVRIASISRLPNAAQGVVTYDVEARILAGAEIAQVASEIALLSDQTGGLAAILGAAGAGGAFGGAGADAGGGAGGRAGAGGGRAGGGLLAEIELPEGTTIRDVLQALAAGEPLPEGVNLPEGLLGAAGGEGADGRPGATGQGALAARPLPAPGMSASVTILTELREPSVLVPVAAVRQLDGAWFVTIPAPAAGDDPAALAFERVTVEIGESDGANVEITSGLKAGAVLLIGADSAGIAFSATQRQLPAFDPGRFFGGGGGGGQ